MDFTGLFNRVKSRNNIIPPNTLEQTNGQVLERFKQINSFIKPIRKNPDLSNPRARLLLSALMGRADRPLEWDNLLDVDLALRYVHQHKNALPQELLPFVYPGADIFRYHVDSLESVGNDVYELSLKSERITHGVNSKNASNSVDYYESIRLRYNDRSKMVVLSSFYPTNATLRGYSVGTKLVKTLERYAKSLGVKMIYVDGPTADAIPFYTRMGFDEYGKKELKAGRN